MARSGSYTEGLESGVNGFMFSFGWEGYVLVGLDVACDLAAEFVVLAGRHSLRWQGEDNHSQESSGENWGSFSYPQTGNS